jgi:RNA polymerase sigma-70 factor (ECF subfamily)
VGTDDPIDDRLTVLANRARADSGAFERLAAAVRTIVVRWAGAATGDRDEAEDVAQLVLLRLQRHVGGHAARGSLRGWLFRVTRNVVLDRRRRERRRQLLLDAEEKDQQQMLSAMEGGAALPPLEPVVRQFMDTLTPRQQEVFELVDLRGFSPAEAAQRLGIKASTARVLLMQARRTLRLKMLQQHPTLLEDYLP